MKKKLRSRNLLTVAAVAAILVLVPAASANAWTASVYHSGPLSPNLVRMSSSWKTLVGGDIEISLIGLGNVAYGKSHVETYSGGTAWYVAEATGTSAHLSHAARASSYSRCWWVQVGAGNGGASSKDPTSCKSRVQ